MGVHAHARLMERLFVIREGAGLFPPDVLPYLDYQIGLDVLRIDAPWCRKIPAGRMTLR